MYVKMFLFPCPTHTFTLCLQIFNFFEKFNKLGFFWYYKADRTSRHFQSSQLSRTILVLKICSDIHTHRKRVGKTYIPDFIFIILREETVSPAKITKSFP